MGEFDKARASKDKGAELLARGKAEAALKEFQNAVSLSPDDVAARKKVADILAKLGRVQPAIAEYQQLAGRYAADGQLAQAIAVGKLILQLDPAHTETQETLARLYAKKSTGGTWLEKIPASMAGALSFGHLGEAALAGGGGGLAIPEVDAAEIARRAGALRAAPRPAEPVEIEIDTSELPRSPLFSDLPRELFMALLNEVEMRTVASGTAIVREGEVGRSMFVLAQGAVKVVRGLGGKDERTVAEMGEGSFFGEIGLLSDVPRLASVVAAGECIECVVLEITREKLGALVAKYPALEPVLQHFYRERLLANLLRSNPLFEGFDEQARRSLIDRFQVRQVPQGTLLVKEGTPGEALFVLLRGTCEPFHVEAGKEHPYPTMNEGAVFGEIALLKGSPATATVRTASPCLLLALDRESFRSHMLANQGARHMLERLGEERLQRTAKLLDTLGADGAAWV
jgi:CRP-like cAMP-binding protein